MKLRLRTHRSRLIATIIGCLVTALLIFLGGYQLAIYQEENDDTLLPFFNSESGTSPMPTFGCGDGLPENCCPTHQLDCAIEDKPIIYLYPTRPEHVTVKLSYVTGFSKTVPAYNPITGWQVFAQPNGQLINTANDKAYPYLFWEGNPAQLKFNMSQGFVISGKATAAFLQQQLITMGLNQTETKAFIAYWLPKMQANTFNLIHFAGSDYTSNAPLSITPRPDSLLRINMAFEALQKPVPVTPQTFPIFHRTGFTVIEWGGTELE